MLDSQRGQFEETLGYLREDKIKLNSECERLRGELGKVTEKVGTRILFFDILFLFLFILLPFILI